MSEHTSKVKNITHKNHNQIYYRSIQNPPESPWLDWIESGKKIYEGRLNRRFWRKIKPGDIIVWNDGRGKKVKTVVTHILKFPSFVEAYKKLGSQLVPVGGVTESKVAQLYHKYFTSDEIKKFGVVAIGIQVQK